MHRPYLQRLHSSYIRAQECQELLTLLACKCLAFPFTSCFPPPALLSFNPGVFSHLLLENGNLYFPHFTPSHSLGMSNVYHTKKKNNKNSLYFSLSVRQLCSFTLAIPVFLLSLLLSTFDTILLLVSSHSFFLNPSITSTASL